MESSWPNHHLKQLKDDGLLRSLTGLRPLEGCYVEIGGKRFIDFSSNDYLGLSSHPALKRAAIQAIEQYGLGARASRLMSGNIELYDALESAVARLKSFEACLVFGSGYLCNLGVISAIAGPGDCIVMDRLCHASIVDGALLSRARIKRFNHNDLAHLNDILTRSQSSYEKIVIIVESLYSMDGDMAPLDELIDLAKRFDAMLMVDEAHATGVFGKDGEGLVARDDAIKPDIVIGTFGKALGGYGAFCCCKKALRDFLINRARGLIYSTGLPPSVLASNIEAVNLLPDLTSQRDRLLKTSAELRHFIKNELKLISWGNSQIVPLVLGDVNKTLALENHLKNNAIFAKAIRPPTVPEGSGRIRFSLSASHDSQVISYLKKTLSSFFQHDSSC